MAKRKAGFTLIELLTTIAIIGVLVSLALPAVMWARESARRVQCMNNLKQLSLAVIHGEETFGHYPSNGWGWTWVGDPDRGYGRNQPGGWIFQTLPFLEKKNIAGMGAGLPDPIKRIELARASQLVVPTLRCPSRPGPGTCPPDPLLEWRNAEVAVKLGRTDYAANGGSIFSGIFAGPNSIAEAERSSYRWPQTEANGIIFQRSRVRHSDIVDGLTHTYMLGEKHVNRDFYAGYEDPGYDQPFTVGDDWDLLRWTDKPPMHDQRVTESTIFGSAHASGFQMALCDGSVRSLSFEMDGLVHRHFGDRADGNSVELP